MDTPKILYISQFYYPESIAPAFRASDNARIWTELGADVTVFTGWPNYPTGKIFDGYDVKLLDEEKIDGVRIIRSKLIAKPNTSFINRVENGLSFLWYGLVNLHRNSERIGKCFDIVFATSGTVFAGYLGYRFSKIMKKPFVLEFRDITYCQLIATGTPKSSLKYRGMKWFELYLAKKADAIIVLTNTFKSILTDDGIDAAKIMVVPNGADVIDLRRERHEGLTLGYFGTIGISQSVPETIKFISDLNSISPGVSYLIIGEGAARSYVEEAAAENEFVELHHGMPKDELEDYYAKLDMSVVTLKKSSAFKGTLPSKIFQSWARGIPVLFFGPDGEAAELIRKNGLGIALCGNESEVRDALLDFFGANDWRERLDAMGCKSKEVVASRYTRRQLAIDLLAVLNDVVNNRKDHLHG